MFEGDRNLRKHTLFWYFSHLFSLINYFRLAVKVAPLETTMPTRTCWEYR